MIYLNKGYFLPGAILLSFLFIPIIILCSFTAIQTFDIVDLLITTILSTIYVVILIIMYKYSKSQKNFLIIEDDHIIINYPNGLGKRDMPKVDIQNIVEIKYYKILSFRVLLLLDSYLLPRATFITYMENNSEVHRHIGYPAYNEIEKLCFDKNIKFSIK